MNQGFVQASSENLPKVDLEMLISYISTNDSFRSTEMRGVKTLRSMRENYGDAAIGYVQLCREGNTCTVVAKVCPEHKVRDKNYTVQILVNEEDESVIKAECQNCAASQGGCKHAVALLAWIYRKSEEPPPTSVTCYWKKPLLSDVGRSIKYKEISALGKKSEEVHNSNDESEEFLQAILNHPQAVHCNSHLIKFLTIDNVQKLSLHYQAVSYIGDKSSVSEFKNYCAEFLSDDHCSLASSASIDQSQSKAWYELRYARITASIIHEAAQCNTPDRSLVDKIMSMKTIDTAPMKRGRELESEVLSLVGEELQRRYDESEVKKCGLLLKREYPMLGASPDGLTDKAVFEIECPFKEKTVSKYFNEKQILNRYRAQLHVQMYFAEKSIGYFCVADPKYESTQKITIIREHFDEKFTMAVIKRAVKFWETNIFPLLMRTV